MCLEAFICSDIITTIMFDCFPAINLVGTLKNPFSKKEMANFGYDDVLLK